VIDIFGLTVALIFLLQGEKDSGKNCILSCEKRKADDTDLNKDLKKVSIFNIFKNSVCVYRRWAMFITSAVFLIAKSYYYYLLLLLLSRVVSGTK
jgi:hypothetical protein